MTDDTSSEIFHRKNMAIKIQLLKNNIKSSPNYGKYYAKTIARGEVTMADLMKEVQRNCSLKEADVIHVITELQDTMKHHLAEGQTIALDGIGRFRLSVESECVDAPEKFNIRRHIRRVICKFLPSSHRNHDGTIQYDFCKDVTVVRR